MNTPDSVRAIVLHEQAQGQSVRLLSVAGVLKVECSPGYRIVATRKRDGSRVVLDPHWPFDAASGVAHNLNSVMIMSACRWHTDIRAERKAAR
jgi:hypothetical protein